MAISVTEKQELRRIMAKRIDKAIKRIREINSIAISEINELALDEISQRLDIKEARANLELAKLKQEKAQMEYDHTREVANAILFGKKYNYYSPKDEEAVNEAIGNRVDYGDLVLQMMSNHHELSQIIMLEDEKERLDEAILISTSQKNVRGLLQELADLLDEKNSRLEEAAQSMPVQEHTPE